MKLQSYGIFLSTFLRNNINIFLGHLKFLCQLVNYDLKNILPLTIQSFVQVAMIHKIGPLANFLIFHILNYCGDSKKT